MKARYSKRFSGMPVDLCLLLYLPAINIIPKMNLNQVTVPVSDVERSISFYEKLGLRLIVKALPHYARFECTDGDSTFSLHQMDNITNNPGTSIYFEVSSLDNFVNQLVEKGIVFDELPNDKSWLWREARLKDPDNNKLIIYFAGDNRKNPPWKI
jgi:catechol 2,3-dioxygenase-like lactoylglutathione lyase family enzyme